MPDVSLLQKAMGNTEQLVRPTLSTNKTGMHS